MNRWYRESARHCIILQSINNRHHPIASLYKILRSFPKFMTNSQLLTILIFWQVWIAADTKMTTKVAVAVIFRRIQHTTQSLLQVIRTV